MKKEMIQKEDYQLINSAGVRLRMRASKNPYPEHICVSGSGLEGDGDVSSAGVDDALS